MKKCVGLFLLVGLCVCGAGVQAATQVSSKDQAVQEVGVAWNMASDRKIENDGGLYQPEGLDKYMKRYFDQFSAKIDQLIERTDRLEKKIDALTPAKPRGGTLVSSQEKKSY
jgi:hypothetical protein